MSDKIEVPTQSEDPDRPAPGGGQPSHFPFGRFIVVWLSVLLLLGGVALAIGFVFDVGFHAAVPLGAEPPWRGISHVVLMLMAFILGSLGLLLGLVTPHRRGPPV